MVLAVAHGPGGEIAAGEPHAQRRRTRFALLAMLAVVAVGGWIRFSVAERVSPVELRGDEVYYLAMARAIALGHGHVHPGAAHDRARRPPAFPWVLSQFIDTRLGDSEDDAWRADRPLVRFEAALGTLVVLLTCLFGRALFDDRVGIVAGAIVAVDPTLVAFSHFLWSETFFTALMMLALLGVVRGEKSGSAWIAAATGVVFGLGVLTREVALPIAVACVLWQVWRAGREVRRAALVRGALTLACAGAVVLPWTARNYAAFHRFVPVSTIGAFAIAEGNTFDEQDWFRGSPDLASFRAAYRQAGGEIERADFAQRYNSGRVRAEQPAWILKKLARNVALLLSPDSYLLVKLREGFYGPVSISRTRCLVASSVLLYALVFVLGVIGITAVDRPQRVLACLVLGAVLAVHVYANSVSRFRVPWMPLMAIFASSAIFGMPRVLRRPSWRAWAVAGAVLVYFFGWCLPYHADALSRMWNEPVPAHPSRDGEGTRGNG